MADIKSEKKPKQPNLDSAAVVARTVSRLLRRHGFQMANTKNRYHWTEGFVVHRIGYSSIVSVSWHSNHRDIYESKGWLEEKKKVWEQLDKAKKLLASRGYVLDQYNYIQCKGE